MTTTQNACAVRKLSDVVGSLRNAGGHCVVLMGAGCSLSAGIPLAGALIREIQARFPEAFGRASEGTFGQPPNYNQCMEELSPNERQLLLNAYIDKASINWAHLALAQLFSNGKIDRVLTVNFDPLLVKACALVNFLPAIYDLAGAAHFKRHRIAPRSLFYLNGQHTGFVTLNAAAELDAHRQKLRTIVQDTGVQRLWLVIGYSGEADPLLDVLTEQECFDGDLYWMGHSPEPSSRLLASGLFDKGRHAFYVGGQDADTCLTELAQKAQCFPPDLLVKPFDHLRRVLENISFDSGGEVARGLQQRLHQQLDAAAKKESEKEEPGVTQAEKWMLAGEYGHVLSWYRQLSEPSAAAAEVAAWACIMQGNALSTAAEATASSDLVVARPLWAQAGEKYAQAMSIKADMQDAANNWGLALAAEARALGSTDLIGARALWAQAGERYGQALFIKADEHEVAHNWASALDDEAQALAPTDLPVARQLWAKAGEKYAQALSIKPDKHEAATNWASALADEAQALAPTDLAGARALWAQAGEKYAQALSIKADRHEVANNWGSALDDEAQALAALDLTEARELWARAGGKYAEALSIKADKYEAANNWGLALANEAQALAQTDLAGARALWTQAFEKYAQALSIKADKHEAAYNWASALDDEARALAPTDLTVARQLWAQAGEKYALALSIKADKHEAAYNWGLALVGEAQALAPTDLPGARALWAKAGEKYAQALSVKADKHEAANNWGSALDDEAQALAPTDLAGARALWAKAGEKYAHALSIKAEKYEAANNWGGALASEAHALAPTNLAGARALWAKAGEKYAQALAIKADMHEAANNWGIALLHEGNALAPIEPMAARALWQQARELLERHATAYPDGRSFVAYNLACAYARCGDFVKAVEQLTLSHEAKALPSHWREDKDLDPIRTTPEFQAWVQQRFPS